MKKNSFSVIILTYNRNKELQVALNSVYNQFYKPSEIIVVNNYPKKIKKNYLKLNKKIKIRIFNSAKNRNAGGGRNYGAKFAKYEYLAFLDDDDFWGKYYLYNASRLIKRHNSDVILSNLFYMNDKNKILKKISQPTIQECFIKNPGSMGSNLIARKRSFMKLKGYKNIFVPAEDKEFLIRVLQAKMKINISNGKVFYNLDSPDSISRNNIILYKGHSKLFQKYKKIINQKNKLFIKFKLNNFKRKSEQNLIFKTFYLIQAIFYFLLYSIN